MRGWGEGWVGKDIEGWWVVFLSGGFFGLWAGLFRSLLGSVLVWSVLFCSFCSVCIECQIEGGR